MNLTMWSPVLQNINRPDMRCGHARWSAQRRCHPRPRGPSQMIGAVCHGKGHLCILLDQQDGHALFVDVLDDVEDLLHQQGDEPMEGSSASA